MAKDLDIVIFGASAVTGIYCLEDIVDSIQKDYPDLTWGAAGRNVSKITATLKDVESRVKVDLSRVPIIQADVKDEPSILAMCERARILINLVGPYALWGEIVVRNCIKAKTHHLDLAGEPFFLGGMRLKYHDEAVKAGVLIIGACGFDSIPVDLGIYKLKDNFPGELAWVEGYVSMKMGRVGYTVNKGTWDSAVKAMGTFQDLGSLAKELFGKHYTKKCPKYQHKLGRKWFPHTGPDDRLYVPFWDTDKWVAKRTHLQNYIDNNERPVQMFSYMKVNGYMEAFVLFFGAMMIALLAQFKPTKKLLHDNPSFFTIGYFSKEGPTREQVEGTSFTYTLIGKGWEKEKVENPEDEPSDAPGEVTKTIMVSGPDPGYVATAACINSAAITLLKDDIPFKGGVITPGLAFRSSNLLSRLSKKKIQFKLLD